MHLDAERNKMLTREISVFVLHMKPVILTTRIEGYVSEEHL